MAATSMPTIIRRHSAKIEAARQARRAANLAYDKAFEDAALAESHPHLAQPAPVASAPVQQQQPQNKQQQHNGKR
jgi:hypothetical protein